MEINVRIPAPLRKLTREQDIIKAKGSTAGEVIQWLTDAGCSLVSKPTTPHFLMEKKGNIKKP